MRIQLLPPNARQIAEEILNGKRPPETDSTEVIEWLVKLAHERCLELEFYRIDSTYALVELSLKQMTIAVKRSIEMRPMPPYLADSPLIKRHRIEVRDAFNDGHEAGEQDRDRDLLLWRIYQRQYKEDK